MNSWAHRHLQGNQNHSFLFANRSRAGGKEEDFSKLSFFSQTKWKKSVISIEILILKDLICVPPPLFALLSLLNKSASSAETLLRTGQQNVHCERWNKSNKVKKTEPRSCRAESLKSFQMEDYFSTGTNWLECEWTFHLCRALGTRN